MVDRQQHGPIIFILGILAGVLVAPPANVAADDTIIDVCWPHVEPMTRQDYDDVKRHPGWYRRWWTGKCDQVPFPDFWTCQSDVETAWNGVVQTVAEPFEGDAKFEIEREICGLGQLVGFEWSKDNATRCVHTEELRYWWDVLEGKPDEVVNLDVHARIARVRKQVLHNLEYCHGLKKPEPTQSRTQNRNRDAKCSCEQP